MLALIIAMCITKRKEKCADDEGHRRTKTRVTEGDEGKQTSNYKGTFRGVL